MRNCTSCGAVVTTRHKYCEDCRDTASPWRPHELNIERARIELGISRPVEIRRSCGKNTVGKYYGISASGVHIITVAARLSPVMASQIIWHELTHARQSERDPKFLENYANSMRFSGYLNNRYEREAKANEDLHNTRFSLARANKRCSLPYVSDSLVSFAKDGHVQYSPKYSLYMTNNDRAIVRAKESIGR